MPTHKHHTRDTASLKGKALKPKSVEMQSLLLYLMAPAGQKKPAVKKAPRDVR